MAFGSKFAGKGAGGKKGPRQVSSKKQHKIQLRPAPAKEIKPVTAPDALDEEDGDEEHDDTDEASYGYRASLVPDRKPLVGLKVSVSGCGGIKEDLLALAVDLGAERHGGLQEDTTHVVTDRAGGAKYQVALSRRMHVMQPSWLPAVQDAWRTGETIDWVKLEDDHVMPPLFGVVACLTHFARGEYKDQFKSFLISAGATLSDKLDNHTTHLIVASPSSPHSQTPSSEKLLHARRNRSRLHPDFAVVWEGWAREAVKYGGRRAERDEVWVWGEKRSEPEEDVRWEVQVEAPRSGGVPGMARSSHSSAANGSSTPTASANQLSSRSRSLVSTITTSNATRSAFKGYDTSLTDGPEYGEDELPVPAPLASTTEPVAYDTANGKVLKKKRTRASAAADTAHESILEAYGASQQAGGSELSRFADADTTLPSLDDALARPQEKERMQEQQEDAEAEMALELVPGEVEPRWVKKSKSTIKALEQRRAGGFAVDAAAKKGKVIAAAAKKAVAGAGDDSGFLEQAPDLSDSAPVPAAAAGAPLPSSSSGEATSSSDDGPTVRIFEGKKLALVEIKGPDVKAVKLTLEARGAEVVIDPSEEEMDGVDWILVDFVEAPKRLTHPPDPRVVTICWLELCIHFDQVIQPEDRLLLRPIPFACPVPGSERFRIHFSGFGRENEPIMHFNRRYTHSVGAVHDVQFSRSSTHLIVRELDDNPSLSASDLDGEANPKVARARIWGTTICSLRDLRKMVEERAMEVERQSVEARENGSKKGNKRERSVREITNELDERQPEEESMRGPLGDCVVFFSTKIDVDRRHLASIVQDLGGTAARQYSNSVTHFVFFGSKVTESTKEFKQAKKRGVFIVHPRWVEECGRTLSRASEGDFPHTFDADKGGQLFDMGMSVNPIGGSPPRSPSMSRQGFAEGESQRQPVARSPSKLSLGRAGSAASAKASPGGTGRKRPLDLDEQDEEELALPASPSPRRRRSDTTVTEIADETDGFGDGEVTGQAFPSPSVAAANPAAAVPSSSSPRPIEPLAHSSADRVPSSDPFEIPPLHSETRVLEKAGGMGGTTQLRQQTSLLLAQLMDGPQQEKPGRTRSRSTLNRKRSSATTSISNTSRHGDTTPNENLTSLAPPPRRMPGTSYGFEPTQATQEGESLYVVYDNPQEAAAREQIKLALAAADGGGEKRGGSPPRGATETQVGETPRTRRSTRATAGRR
ncbi:hypothetical protein JCM11251_001880 [Rhodosporidiobolus azoricus]